MLEGVPEVSTKTLDDYELVRCLGRGSFGQVWLCRNTGTDAHVAVKVVDLSSLNTRSRNAMLNEVQMLRRASSASSAVVQLYDAFVSHGKLFVVMQYISGGDLSASLSRGRLSESRVWNLAGRMLQALAMLHQNNLIHRDIKPANILVDGDEFYLADMGLSRALSETGLAQTVCGTPLYMAPEIMLGHRYNCVADIWSLGCVLYQCCTGVVPFSANSKHRLVEKVLRAGVDQPLPKEYSTPLARLISYCLMRRPERRPGAADLLGQFGEFLPVTLPLAPTPVADDPIESEDELEWLQRREEIIEREIEAQETMYAGERDRLVSIIQAAQQQEAAVETDLDAVEKDIEDLRATNAEAQASTSRVQRRALRRRVQAITRPTITV